MTPNFHKYYQIQASIFLILFFFQIPILLYAEVSPSSNVKILNLPQSDVFKNQKDTTFKILKALIHEEEHSYREAYSIWKNLSQNNPTIRDHLFRSNLISFPNDDLPEDSYSEKSISLLARYLSWQKKWDSAVKLMQSYGKIDDFHFNNKLELIRLNLCLGDYQMVQIMFQKLQAQNRSQHLQEIIVRIWYNVLLEQDKIVYQNIDSIEEDYLYLTVASVFPRQIERDVSRQKSIYDHYLVRFPNDEALFERLAIILLRERDWNELSNLIQSQNLVSALDYDWKFLAVLYLETNQLKELDELIKSPDIPKNDPTFYDIIAQRAISRKNWKLLQRITEIYSKYFPKILDGKLYEIILYSQSGQQKKAEQLQKEIGL